jgi:outer membrane protein OmpA-like peptidoglycan-associated protein
MMMSNRAGGKGKDDIWLPQPYRCENDFDLTPEVTMTEPTGFNWMLFFFNFNESKMLPEYLVQLDELVAAMKEFPGPKFEISGHTDSRGSYDYNKKLSQKRAEYVKSLLEERGMSASDMTAEGRSFSEPVIPNAQTEPEHEQNRRVEVRIIE